MLTREEAIANAHTAIDECSENYRTRLEHHLGELRQALQNRDKASLTRVANDLKGEAGTMGWPLVSQAAGWMRQLLDAEPETVDILSNSLFVQSLERMVADDMTGESAEGVELVKQLYALAIRRGIKPA